MKNYPRLFLASLFAAFLLTSCADNSATQNNDPAISGLFEGPVGAVEFFADNTYTFTTRVSKFDGHYEFAGKRVTLYSGKDTFFGAYNVLPGGELKSHDGHYSMKKVDSPGELLFKIEE